MSVKQLTGALSAGPTGATGPPGPGGGYLDAATVSVIVKSAPYNAKGDGIYVGGATITAGSTALSVTGGFVSGDVGKRVLVSGAGAGGGTALATSTASQGVGVISSLPINALAADMPATNVLFSNGTNTEYLAVAAATAGATSLQVTGFLHNTYPSGSTVYTVGDPLSSTIASVSGGVATLADAAGTTIAGGHYCCYGTDDTAAIQAAIDAVGANVRGRVIFPDGVYIVGNALRTTGGYRSQLLLPLRDVLTAPKGVVVLEGATPGGGQPTLRNGLDGTGALLQSTLVGINATGGIPSVLGGPVDTTSGLGDTNLTNIHAEIRNLDIRCPSNPSVAAINLQKVQTARLDSVRIDTMEQPSGYSPGDYMIGPSHPTGIGVLMPMNFSQSGDANQLHINGFYAGLATGEHTVADYVFIAFCRLGLSVYPSHHINSLGYIDIEQCAYVIGYNDPATGVAPLLTGLPSRLTIESLDIEDKETAGFPAWSRPIQHINDPGNKLYARINYHRVVAVTGAVTDPLTVNGGANVALRSSTPKEGTATLVAGTVNVADTNVTATTKIRLTNLSPGGTPGALWVVLVPFTRFEIHSSSGADTSSIFWEIVRY